MTNTDKAFLTKIKIAINRNSIHYNEKTKQAIERLTKSEIAKAAWLRLAKKELLQSTESEEDGVDDNKGIFYVAEIIGWCVDDDIFHERWPIVKQAKAKQLSKEALKHVSNLKNFLMAYPKSFQMMGILPEGVDVALLRVNRGLGKLYLEKLKQNETTEEIFPDQIEQHLNQLDIEHYSEIRMTSAQAYSLLGSGYLKFGNQFLIDQLEILENHLIKHKVYAPLARPDKELASEHLFAIELCQTMQDFYGSPLHEIVADFTTAVFDKEIDAEAVKKWWQRSKSKQGDNLPSK